MRTLVAIIAGSPDREALLRAELRDDSLEVACVAGLEALGGTLGTRTPTSWVVDAEGVAGREVECMERLARWGPAPVLVVMPSLGFEQNMAAWFDLGAADCVTHHRELRTRLQHRIRLLKGVGRSLPAFAAALPKPDKLLRRVIESSVDAIVASDVRGRLLLFNPAATRITGYSEAEVGCLTAAALYPDDGAKEVMRAIRSSEHGGVGKLFGYRCVLLAKHGLPIPVSLSAALILDRGTPVASVGVFTDIREKLRMEADLDRARAALEERHRQVALAELAGAAAHELNQPLTSVMGYCELLQRRVQTDETASELAGIVVQEARRLASIVQKIGQITRYETQGYVGDARILDLGKATGEPPPAGPPSASKTPSEAWSVRGKDGS